MTTLGKRLLQSANEAVAIARGKADPTSYKVFVPTDVDVANIRRGLRMTQAQFASTFGFPITTLRDWEQGRARPDTSARAYLLVIDREPTAVKRALRTTLPTRREPTRVRTDNARGTVRGKAPS
jgi:putative transcriptional regulator